MKLIRAAFAIGSLTMTSRVLGLVRDVLMAALLGAGFVADAFVIAFKLPNFFRRLFAEGGFNNAFVPLYTETLANGGLNAAQVFARHTKMILGMSLILVSGAVLFFMDHFILVFAPGFADDPVKLALAIELSRITFPYLITISLVALYGAILNAHGKFAAVAATPVVLNLCMIGSLLFGGVQFTMPRTALQAAQALSWGLAIAGLVQLFWLMAYSQPHGMFLKPTWPRMTPLVKRLFVLIGPALLAVSASQVNSLIDMALASTLQSGAVSWLYYADRLAQLPLGVVGVAMGTALLPMLSRIVAEKSQTEALASQNRALEVTWFITLPAAVGLSVAAVPIITVLFERWAFNAIASTQAAYALAAYACGLPAYVGIKIFGPGFFARQDTGTPTKIAVASVGANIVLNFALIGPLGHVGLALATALAAWLNFSLLAIILHKRGHFKPDLALGLRLLMQFVSASIMAAAVWVVIPLLEGWWRADIAQQLIGLGIIIGSGVLIFVLLAFITRAVKVSHLKSLARRDGNL